MSKVKIRPLNMRVVIKPDVAEETTASGLYIPDSAKEKPQTGTVVAISNITSLKEGEKVIYGKFTGTDVEIDGENYLILKESDIFAVIG
ncbi:MAG: co-chaperone GroES [Chitinophagales bacterium]